jgi:signal transduction histidine kinase
MTRLSLTGPAFQPGGQPVISRESVLDVRLRAYPVPGAAGVPPTAYAPRRTQRTCLRRYRESVSAQSPPAPAVTDGTAPRQPTPARRPKALGPPLTMRIRRAHWVVLDCVLAAGCAVIIFSVLYKGAGSAQLPLSGWRARDWLPPLLAVCLSMPVAIRRRDPLLALALVLAGCAGVLALEGEITRGPFLPLAIVLYLVAATYSRRAALTALVASLVLFAVQGLILHLNGGGAGNAIGVGLILIICWMIGDSVRQRRAYAARLRQQAADSAVTAERLRIARDLHDVVAHSMTVVAVQAGFGEYVFDSQPAQARAALGAIQTVTSEALADMQRMLGALRQAGSVDGTPATADGAAGPAGSAPAPAGQARILARPAAPLAPASGLTDLDRLVAGTAGAGVRVEVLRTGQASAIPPGIDASAFRIVQEALTNVVKHSGADHCLVRVVYGADDLCIEITDPGQQPVAAQAAAVRVLAMADAPAGAAAGPGACARAGLAPGTGHGIAGMRERVSLYGGEFAAAPLPGQGFRVVARFPLPHGAR